MFCNYTIVAILLISETMSLLIRQWNIVILVTVLTLFDVIYGQNCTDSLCYVKPGAKSFAQQVIEAGKKYSNYSFTILAYAGNYNATSENFKNFFNFINVTIKKHPDNTMPVHIMCPSISFGPSDRNGIGFEYSANIEISGLHFMRCGINSAGLYFLRVINLIIHDSTFHHNSDNGILIVAGNNVSIFNCSFYKNIGLQPDHLSDLIINDALRIRGIGLGLFFKDQNNVSVTVKDCNFTNNIAYKTANYDPSVETRPYGFIPFGNGGGIYLKLNRVNHSNISILNSIFYNNTAIHQGGAIVMIPLNSSDNVLNIFGCKFVGNKVLGFLLATFNVTVNDTRASVIDNFINEVNKNFSIATLIFDTLRSLDFDKLRPSGGSGGAIAVSLFGSVDRNVLHVSDSQFIDNVAFLAGAINFIVRDLLSEVEGGVDSNQAFFTKYVNVTLYIDMCGLIIIVSATREIMCQQMCTCIIYLFSLSQPLASCMCKTINTM